MEGHVRQRKNRDGSLGSWQVIVHGGRDRDGKRITLSGSRPTKKAAIALRNELIAQVDGTGKLGSSSTVAELFEEYMKVGGPATETSRYDYRSIWNKHLKKAIGDIPARKLRARDLNAVYGAMRDAGSAPNTVRKVHVVASAMCTYGARNEWFDTAEANPARKATPPPAAKTQVRATPVADITAVIKALDGSLFGLYVLTSAALGTRRGETLGLRWSDIDFDLGQVTIERRVTIVPGGAQVEEFTKNASARTLAVDAGTIERLRSRLVEAQATAALADGHLEPTAYIFTDELDGHRPWHPSSASHRMAKVRKRLGLSDAHLHGLRHHVATSLLAAGVDVRTVAERLGNSPEVVLRVYAHFVPAKDQAAADLLGAALRAAPGVDGVTAAG